MICALYWKFKVRLVLISRLRNATHVGIAFENLQVIRECSTVFGITFDVFMIIYLCSVYVVQIHNKVIQ